MNMVMDGKMEYEQFGHFLGNIRVILEKSGDDVVETLGTLQRGFGL